MQDLISKYLQDGTLESQGEFTLSPQKALEKFGRKAFPRKTAWLTKLLQAVAGTTQGAEMAVVTKPGQTSITLKGKNFFLGADTLMQKVLDLEKCGFGDPLIDGLRYLASAQPQSLDLLSVDRQDCKIARLTKDGVQVFHMEWPEDTSFLEIQISGQVELGTESEFKDELHMAAGFLGFPVSCNGKKLQGAWAGSGSGHVPGYGETRLAQLAKKFHQEQRTLTGQVLGQRPDTDRIELAYSVKPAREGSITLNWADKGVVLRRERTRISRKQEVQILLPFQQAQADLGGFNFQHNFHSKQLLDGCTPLVANLLANKKTEVNGGFKVPQSVSKWKFLLRPVVSLLWFLNYGWLVLSFCAFIVGLNDIFTHGWNAVLFLAVGTVIFLAPTFILMWLKTWLDEPVTSEEPAALQPQSWEQVAVTPLSQLEWADV